MRIFTFARAVYHVLVYLFAGKPILVPTTILKHRESVCDACKYNDFGTTCRLCKCYIPAKVYVASEVCPDNPPRWKSY